ncbi:MAG: NHL repeat-containing protein [bacterium]
MSMMNTFLFMKTEARKILPAVIIFLLIQAVCLPLIVPVAIAQGEEATVVPNREAECIGKIYGFSEAKVQDTDEAGGTPVYIAQNSKGHIYVVYSGQSEEVQVFDQAGKFLFQFGARGEEEGAFSSYICGMAINSRDEVYVCDVFKKKILVFDARGTFMFSFSSIQGLTKEDKRQNTRPSHIGIDQQDRVYISDTTNGHVWVHDAQGHFLHALGGTEEGRYPTAGHIRFDKQGRIYILEGLANSLQVCDSQGNLLFQIGKTGSQAGQFLRISGVAIDSRSRIYITDIVLSVIQVFDSEGNLLGVIKSVTDKEGNTHEFKGLSNIFIGREDCIYLIELPFHRVTVIRDKH